MYLIRHWRLLACQHLFDLEWSLLVRCWEGFVLDRVELEACAEDDHAVALKAVLDRQGAGVAIVKCQRRHFGLSDLGGGSDVVGLASAVMPRLAALFSIYRLRPLLATRQS